MGFAMLFKKDGRENRIRQHRHLLGDIPLAPAVAENQAGKIRAGNIRYPKPFFRHIRQKQAKGKAHNGGAVFILIKGE